MSVFLTIAVVHLIALMSPGPDFLLAVKTSLGSGQRAGIGAAVGFGLGILLHVSYCLLGIGILISESILLFNVMKFLGAGYLCYIGIQSLRSHHQNLHVDTTKTRPLSVLQAIRMGFLTNALNPKATLFMLALFTQVIDPTTPTPVQVGYGLYMGLQTVAWFSLVAVVLSAAPVRERFVRMSTILDRLFGAALIALSAKIALSTRE